MRKLFFLLVGLVAASCVSPVPAEAQVNVSVMMDKTNSWLRSANFIRSNWFAGSGISFAFGSNGSLTISASGGSGQPASANLTNWSNVGTNQVVFVTDFQTYTNGIGVAYQPADAQLTNLAGLSYGGNASKYIRVNAGETGFELATVSGGGDVTGPASSTDNGLAVYDGATGKLLKNSNVTLTGLDMAGLNTLTASNLFALTTFTLSDHISAGGGITYIDSSIALGDATGDSVTINGTLGGTLQGEPIVSLTDTAINISADKILYRDADDGGTLKMSVLPTALVNWSLFDTNMLRTVTNNFSVYLQEANPTNVVNMNLASTTNILNGNLTLLYATNGISGYERTHVRWLWAGGSDRTLTIPSGWKTNVFSAVPASITNGTITKMYVTTIGPTSNSAEQTNVFVSFEFYK